MCVGDWSSDVCSSDLDAVEMNYALWNTKSNSFDKNMEKSTYDLNSGGMTRLLASAK